jgi:DNA-binding ferritin-like protein
MEGSNKMNREDLILKHIQEIIQDYNYYINEIENMRNKSQDDGDIYFNLLSVRDQIDKKLNDIADIIEITC